MRNEGAFAELRAGFYHTGADYSSAYLRASAGNISGVLRGDRTIVSVKVLYHSRWSLESSLEIIAPQNADPKWGYSISESGHGNSLYQIVSGEHGLVASRKYKSILSVFLAHTREG